jgi:hypothetical protein
MSKIKYRISREEILNSEKERYEKLNKEYRRRAEKLIKNIEGLLKYKSSFIKHKLYKIVEEERKYYGMF